MGPCLLPRTNVTMRAALARPTCQLRGAGPIGRYSPCISVFANLLNSTGVETLVHSCHIENPQPVQLSLSFLIQTELRLGKTAGVVPKQLHFLYAHLGNKKLSRLQRRRRCGRRGRVSWSCRRREEPAKNEDTAAPLPLGHQTRERQVIFLGNHDSRAGNHGHV